MEAETLRRRSWIGWSWIGGGIVGLPAGVLLAYLAVLPFFLGLFFFLLVGLLIGAVMFRLGRRAAPARRSIVWLMGLDVAVFTWGTGLVVEYLGFAGDAAREVRKSLPMRLSPEQQEELYDKTRRHVLSRFAGRDARGGFGDTVLAFPGYLAWVATDGTMQCPRVLDPSVHRLVLAQRGIGWLLRVILSLGLLCFTILSQLVALARPPEPADSETEAEQPGGAG